MKPVVTKPMTPAVCVILLVIASPCFAQNGTNKTGDPSAIKAVKAEKQQKKEKRWRPEPPPLTVEEAEDPLAEDALKNAPPVPPLARPYHGRDEAMKGARSIRKRIPTFINFRAAIPRATWRVAPFHEWRVRPLHKCRAELRSQKLKFTRYEPPEEPEQPEKQEKIAQNGEEEEGGVYPTPTPVIIRGPIEGVEFITFSGRPILVSGEFAARLKVMSRIVSHYDVDQIVVMSSYRPRPRPSFHTMGMGLDIARFHVRTPVRGASGRRSQWLTVETDFVETPDVETCHPDLFEENSRLGKNERARRLLGIACDLFDSGVFSSVLTPNYNPGHRDHFHIDIRPDDPRLFLR